MSFVQSTDTTDPSESGDTEDLVAQLGSELQVVVDRWSVGQIGLSDILVAVGVIIGAAFAGWVARRLFSRFAKRVDGAMSTAALLGGQMVTIAIYLFAAVIVLEVLGFSLGPVLILVLVVLVAILFIQPLILNLSAGLLLQLRGPFSPGDTIETDDVIGEVSETNARTVVVMTSDGQTVHVPNRHVLNSVLVNLSDQGRRRSELELRVVSDTDFDALTEQLCRTAGEVNGILSEPAPDVLLAGFEGSLARVVVRFWHEPDQAAERAARDGLARRLAILTSEEGGLELGDPVLEVQSVATPGPE